jgi:hypothetical protein
MARPALLATTLAVLCAAARPSAAGDLAAIVDDAADVRKATLIGPSGQVYEPDGAGAWVHRVPGGVAADVTAAMRLGGSIVVTGRAAPMYAFDGKLWRATPIGQRGRVMVAAGPAPCIAIGAQIFIFEKKGWVRVATAPAPITALWAGSKGNLRVATATEVWTLRGGAFQKLSPATVATAFVGASAPLAVSAAGLVEVDKAKAPLLAPLTDLVGSAVAPKGGDAWLVTAPAGAPLALSRLRAGKLAPAISTPLAAGTALADVSVDSAGRVLLITRTGEIHLWDGKVWSVGSQRTELPAPGRGPGPARTS